MNLATLPDDEDPTETPAAESSVQSVRVCGKSAGITRLRQANNVTP